MKVDDKGSVGYHLSKTQKVVVLLKKRGKWKAYIFGDEKTFQSTLTEKFLQDPEIETGVFCQVVGFWSEDLKKDPLEQIMNDGVIFEYMEEVDNSEGN